MENEEINLMDYIKVIVKRWRMILAITLGITLAVFLISFLSPKASEVSTILEIGALDKSSTLIEAPAQIIKKVEGGVYESAEGVKAENPASTNLISMKIKTNNPEEAKEKLEKLNNAIISEHQNLIGKQKELLKSQIDNQEDKIKSVESKISSAEEEKKIIEEKINELEKIGPYQQSIVFQLSLLDERQKLENKKSEIENLQTELFDLRDSILSAKSSLEFIQPTKVAKAPSVSPDQKRVLFNTLIALILGLFIGVVAAFVGEWWGKNKKELTK